MGTTRNVDMSANQNKIKIVKSPEKKEDTKKPVLKKKNRVRSKKYQAARSQVDKSKQYDTFAAIELAKRLSYSKFTGSIEAHGVLRETGLSASFSFPYSTGKTIKAVIASDKVIAQIADGKIDFDVLISTKEFMPKLTKFARLLGPKGLMPNPKNGTLTEKPEAKQKELAKGKITIKTEKKAPLFHTIIGKTSMETKELVANLNALIKAFKGNLIKLSISASMGPGIKVQID